MFDRPLVTEKYIFIQHVFVREDDEIVLYQNSKRDSEVIEGKEQAMITSSIEGNYFSIQNLSK